MMDKSVISTITKRLKKKDLIALVEALTLYNEYGQDVLLEFCHKFMQPGDRDFYSENQIINHWNNALEIIDEANTYGGCSESDGDEAKHEIESLVKIFKTNIITTEVQEGVIDVMLDQNIYHNSGFTDLLVDSLMEICQLKDAQEYLADGLAESTDKYYRGLAASIYLKIEHDHDYLEMAKSNLEYASEYLSLANYYNKIDDKEMALKMVWEGLNNGVGSLGEIYVYLFEEYKDDTPMLMKIYKIAKNKKRDMDTITELLYHLYRRENDYPNKKKMLFEMFKYCENKELAKWYRISSEELNQADWIEFEPKIFNEIKDKSTLQYLNICLEKNNTSEVLDYLKKQPRLITWEHLDVNHQFSNALSKTYPKEIVELYWEEVHANMDMKKEKFYQEALNILKEIRTIMFKNTQYDEWEKRYEELVTEHKRKKLFINMIGRNM
ncbi:MAG: hypothetical protein GX829_06120 [Clostridium sp.]|nr:hypothetical protein [Clostridium sp.]